MTNYVGFINSMLSLREQRLKEALARQAEEQQQRDGSFASQMGQMGKGLAGMFGSIGQNQQEGRQDAIANSLMNRQEPRVPLRLTQRCSSSCSLDGPVYRILAAQMSWEWA